MTWAIHSISRFAEFSEQWDKLVRSRSGPPILESAFIQPLIDTFGCGDERLCLYHSKGHLQTATIIQRERNGMWQTFQPSQLPLGAWISDRSMDLVSTSNELLSQLPGLTLGIGITQQDTRLQVRPIDDFKVRTHDYIQTAWVDIDDSFETYWETRGKNIKQNMRKQRNKLQAEGVKTRLDCITAAKDVAKAIEHYGRLESAGWKSADGTAIHPDNAQGKFYQRMLENFCNLKQTRIYIYSFDEKVVAMDLCIHDDTTIVILKTTYDESYKAVSPSTLMRQTQFQQLFEEQKFKRIEFYGKVMEWHTRWTENASTVYHINSYRYALVTRLLDLRAGMRKSTSQSVMDDGTDHA